MNAYTCTKMFLLVIISNYKNFCNLNIVIFIQIKFFIKKIKIFFHCHIFDPSAIDLDYWLKCHEIFYDTSGQIIFYT